MSKNSKLCAQVLIRLREGTNDTRLVCSSMLDSIFSGTTLPEE
jgi:hypothetical protein